MKLIKALKVLLLVVVLSQAAVIGAGDAPTPPKQKWSSQGIRSTFDRKALQRGLMVYKQVCAACHSANYLSYRDLKDLGYSNGQIKAFAAEDQVKDVDEDGEDKMRPAKPADMFVAPYANANQAMASNNGKVPPDLTNMAKARIKGPDYMYALLALGYVKPPKGMNVDDGLYYNKYFPGGLTAMAPPLQDGMVTYDDGTKATVEQMTRDVVEFLTWASDPSIEMRKRMGMKFMIFMLILTLLMYFTKRKIWADIYKKA